MSDNTPDDESTTETTHETVSETVHESHPAPPPDSDVIEEKTETLEKEHTETTTETPD